MMIGDQYEIGSNNTKSVGGLNFRSLSDRELSEFCLECVMANELVALYAFLGSPAVSNLKMEDLYEPLRMASAGGQLAHVDAILDAGIEPSSYTGSGETPIGSAAAWGNDCVLTRLIDRGWPMRRVVASDNEELTLMIRNCGSQTTLSVLSQWPEFESEDYRLELQKFAVSLGRKDVAKAITQED